MQSEDEKTEAEVAAEKRRALRASLERERDGYKTRGLDDRASQVEEQLKLLDGEGDNPTEEEDATREERVSTAPVETAVDSKPRRTAAGRGKPGSA